MTIDEIATASRLPLEPQTARPFGGVELLLFISALARSKAKSHQDDLLRSAAFSTT